MLYDPKWEAPTKADPLTLDGLIAWLERQPPRQKYCYDDTGGCLIHQYLTASGFRDLTIGGDIFFIEKRFFNMPRAIAELTAEEPHTFGAALRRARKAASRT